MAGKPETDAGCNHRCKGGLSDTVVITDSEGKKIFEATLLDKESE